MKRLFFALWPDETTRAKIDHLNESLICGRLKKARSNNLHVTLAFMGNVDDIAERAIRQHVAQITAKPITLFFDQLTTWESARVLCITTSNQPRQITDLVEQLKIVIEQYGVVLESRSYTAHVTLARKAQVNPTVIVEPINWQSSHFVLVESVSTSKGVDYHVLDSWSLNL